MKQIKKIVTTTVTGLAVLTALGSGTLLTMHAANGVSSVGQTLAPKTATVAGSQLTAASASGTKQNYTVAYHDQSGDKAATLQKRTLGSTSTAVANVNYLNRSTPGPTVKLNSQTTAVEQGIMGHTVIHWNTGNWSVTAITSNADRSGNPTQFAKQINGQLANEQLPDNATTGAVTVYSQTAPSSAQVNTVKWQSGNQLYTVSGQNAASTVKLAQNSDK